jgi:hypothetical protein
MPRPSAEAASRPTIRFVAVKSEDQQAQAMVFRTRDLLVRQRTQTINALRGHLAEHGVIARQGLPQIGQLVTAIDDAATRLPSTVRELGPLLLDQIAWLDTKIAGPAKAIRAAAAQDEEVTRLTSMPGISPICAMAIRAFAPALEGFGSCGFPESHAASFALFAYASSWLKCHHPVVFCAALLNAQPMGFCAPAQIVRDAQEHGVEVRPVCINASR